MTENYEEQIKLAEESWENLEKIKRPLNHQFVELGNFIGRGGSATIFEGKHGGRKVAIRRITCEPENQKRIRREIITFR